MAIDKQLQELLDKQALHELAARWAQGLDRCDEELFLSCYHPDAVEYHGSKVAQTPEQMVQAYLPRLRQLNVCHFNTNELFETDGDTAYGDFYIAVFIDEAVSQGRDGLSLPTPIGRMVTAAGRNLDRYERRDEEWKIACRVSVFDWPPVGARDPNAINGRQDRDDPMYSFKSGDLVKSFES